MSCLNNQPHQYSSININIGVNMVCYDELGPQ
jgi:hypothetical protein